LTASRYLPRSASLRWSHDRVFFQIDDLNVLYTQLLPKVTAAARELRLAVAVRRARVIRTAASWSRDATLAGVGAYLAERVLEPDDLFGPAFLLRALAPDEPRTRALVEGLPRPVSRVLGALSVAMGEPDG
jgi:hypothetical protein